MGDNATLTLAKKAKQDEFYTQYADIQTEMNAYLEYDPTVFKGATILLPCDDPEWSNFTRYFAENFAALGLKKLISTSYAPASKTAKYGSLFEYAASQNDATPKNERGKIFVLDHDVTGDGKVNFEDIKWTYLKGDGDFRSDEVRNLRDEADVIITNPPFSLFREFLAWIMEADKKFSIIGNRNAITYKEVFPLIKEDNVKYSRHKEVKGIGYQEYDNYDAIEVPFTDAIPSDYDGIMGVPISFLDKYCPEQFEIVGMCENEDLYGMKTRVYTHDECQRAYLRKFGKKGTYDLNASGVLTIEGIQEKVYQRILVRWRR